MHSISLLILTLITITYALPNTLRRQDTPSQLANNFTAPASSTPKLVVAHHIVGNTFPYTTQDWENDINLAYASSIDGFALNLGTDSWQPQQVADAYVIFPL
jgi:hypothetical protein